MGADVETVVRLVGSLFAAVALVAVVVGIAGWRVAAASGDDADGGDSLRLALVEDGS